MQIDVWTLALQTINFLVLVWLLQRFLYKPLMAVVKRRRVEIDLAFAEAEQRQQAADALRQQYEARIAALHEERDRLIHEAEATIERHRQEMLAHARAEAEKIIDEARRQAAQEREAATAALMEQVVDLAHDLASRLLRQVAAPNVAEAFLDRVLASLDGFEPERLEELKAELAGDGALRVATAPALDPAAQVRWRQRLRARLGSDVRIEFAADESLIAGAELRFPHMIIGLSWRDGLNEARRELLSHGHPH